MNLFHRWKPKPGIIYREYHTPYIYVRGKHVDAYVYCEDKWSPPKPCTFMLKNGIYEIHINHKVYLVPEKYIKVNKDTKKKFVSEQPDLGWIITVTYLVEVKEDIKLFEKQNTVQ